MKTFTEEELLDYNEYRCIVIGVSAGGMLALSEILPELSTDFPVPIVIVQHLHPNQGKYHIQYFKDHCQLIVKEADELDVIKAGTIYFAAPNYHLLLEENLHFSFSIDRKVNYSRPSIDVMFVSAIDAFDGELIGIILTGANNDGATGLKQIKENGGITIVQDPKNAEVSSMPQAAINLHQPDFILTLHEIKELLIQSYKKNKKKE